MANRFGLAILLSGEGSNLQAIINAIAVKTLDAEIVLVVSNKADAAGLSHARKAGLTCKVIPAIKAESRSQYDQRLVNTLMPYAPDLIVLAGFMRILSPRMIQSFAGKIVNIHPSLLPAYKGLNTHQRVIDAGEQYHGATVHYVTQALDDGELIIQSRIETQANDTAQTLRTRVQAEEHIIYPRAIQWLKDKQFSNRTSDTGNITA